LYLRHDIVQWLGDIGCSINIRRTEKKLCIFYKQRKPGWKEKTFLLVRGDWVRRKP
jgi:hypothetical protein